MKVEVVIDGDRSRYFLRRCDQDVEGIFEQGDCRVQFYFHEKDMRGPLDMIARRARRESDGDKKMRVTTSKLYLRIIESGYLHLGSAKPKSLTRTPK